MECGNTLKECGEHDEGPMFGCLWCGIMSLYAHHHLSPECAPWCGRCWFYHAPTVVCWKPVESPHA